MTRTRLAGLIAGAIVTIAVFSGLLYLMLYGGFVESNHIMLFVSIALGPVAAVSVIAGYLVWWLVLFLLTLLNPDSTGRSDPQ
jgi:hypothetical protein